MILQNRQVAQINQRVRYNLYIFVQQAELKIGTQMLNASHYKSIIHHPPISQKFRLSFS